MVDARLNMPGEPDQLFFFPRTEKLSDSIQSLKAAVVAHFSEYFTRHNVSKEEVNLMEEVVSEDEKDLNSSKKRKGVKRKKALTSPPG